MALGSCGWFGREKDGREETEREEETIEKKLKEREAWKVDTSVKTTSLFFKFLLYIHYSLYR